MVRGFDLVSKYKECVGGEFQFPKRATSKSAGYDIYNNTGKDIHIPAGCVSSPITTYLKSYMQDDEVLELYVRSSYGFKFQTLLANGTGIIDADYFNNSNNEGEIFVKFFNHGNQAMTIKDGEAMVQGIFKKYLTIDDDNATGQRQGGIGSTSKE